MTKITTEELERLVALLDDNAPHVAGWQDGDAGEDIPLDAGLADSAKAIRELIAASKVRS